jgi:hypothetical protein
MLLAGGVHPCHVLFLGTPMTVPDIILTERELPQDDKVTDTDWYQLEGIYYGLKPF